LGKCDFQPSTDVSFVVGIPDQQWNTEFVVDATSMSMYVDKLILYVDVLIKVTRHRLQFFTLTTYKKKFCENNFFPSNTYKNKTRVLRKDLKMKERTPKKELHQTNAQLAGKVCRSPKGSQAPKPNVLDLLVRDRMFSV